MTAYMNIYRPFLRGLGKGLYKSMANFEDRFPRAYFLLWLAKYRISNPGYLFKNMIRNPPLTAIAVEINSFCNRKCRFCPNFNHAREEVFLEGELFYKIVSDLKKIGFKGSLTFNMYNEPLLDERLSSFIEYVRKELPRTYIYLNTNGDLLDMALWKKLRATGLDFVNITQYDGKINNNIQDILAELSPSEKKHIHAHTLDYICNRGGLVETGQDTNLRIKSSCPIPFCQLNINYKGRAVLCCNDYLGLVEIGDLRSLSVDDIWKSEALRYYRKRLFSEGRANLKLCECCDSL